VVKNLKIQPKSTRSGGEIAFESVWSERFSENHEDLEDLGEWKKKGFRV
jgi:hypothetical protein